MGTGFFSGIFDTGHNVPVSRWDALIPKNIIRAWWTCQDELEIVRLFLQSRAFLMI